MKTGTNFPKLSTAAAMIIGHHAQRHIIELSREQFDCYLQRKECELVPQQLALCEDTGFVIVSYRGYIAGLGLYLSAQHDKLPRLRSLFPKYLTS